MSRATEFKRNFALLGVFFHIIALFQICKISTWPKFQIYYPLTRAGAMARGLDVSDEKLVLYFFAVPRTFFTSAFQAEVFGLVHLDLGSRGWDYECEWSQTLSLGEQQKIGIVSESNVKLRVECSHALHFNPILLFFLSFETPHCF